MKEDIRTRNDIEKMIIHFYEKVKPNREIGFIFTKLVNIHWEHHIPLIVDFWETILLDNPVYKKNAMEIHYELDYSSVAHLSNQFKKITGLTPSHFKKIGADKRKMLDQV